MARLAQLSLALFLLGVTVLHLLPSPLLHATTGKQVPYDLRLNFLSEFVRTQYGPLMSANFVFLLIAALGTASALRAVGAIPEARGMLAGAVCVALLLFFPTDLADLRTDAYTCGDPTRVEPCTWVGRVHNPLSTLIFGTVGWVIVRLAKRPEPEWRGVALAGRRLGVLLVVLLIAAELTLVALGLIQRHWVGLMQRAVALPVVLWLIALNKHLARRG